MKALCRCGSGESYGHCCMPLHEGGIPANALALMRSRYTAYSLGDVDYIIKTTHKDNPEKQLPLEVQKSAIQKFCDSTEFRKLEILDVQEGEEFSTVTFSASLSQNDKDCSFTEKSLFKKENNFWQYVNGEVN